MEVPSPPSMLGILRYVIISMTPESLGGDTDDPNGVIPRFGRGQDTHLLGLMAFRCGSYLRSYQSVSLAELFIGCFLEMNWPSAWQKLR